MSMLTDFCDRENNKGENIQKIRLLTIKLLFNILQEDGVENKEKRAEFVFEIFDGSLFAVVGYGGDASLAYLCIEANRAALFHAGRYNFYQNLPGR